MLTANTDQSVIVSNISVASDDPFDIVHSSITFLDALRGEFLELEELSQDALRSYYVNYYFAQMNNGGFSQFVSNTGWDKIIVRYIHEGLQAIGAHQCLELFNQGTEIVDRLGVDQFFASEELREQENELTCKFYDLREQEDLVLLNANWLRSLPHLVVLSIEAMQAEVKRRAAALPDREARLAQALARLMQDFANEPRYFKLILAVCLVAGHKFSHITAQDSTYKHNGQTAIAWHFITHQGKHYLIEADGKAMMFNTESHELLLEIAAPAE